MTSRNRQPSGPAVVVHVVGAVLKAVWACIRVVIVPLARWYMRKLREGWDDVQTRRTTSKAAKEFRPNRRQQKRIARSLVHEPDPDVVYRALWWAMYVMAKEIPPTTMANHMAHTKPDFHEAIAYLAGQIYTIPTRFPTEIEAMVWATEIKALHGVEHRLPQVENW